MFTDLKKKIISYLDEISSKQFMTIENDFLNYSSPLCRLGNLEIGSALIMQVSFFSQWHHVVNTICIGVFANRPIITGYLIHFPAV